MANPILVSIVMGSDSDLPIMEEAAKILKEFDVGHETMVTSAHRSPNRTHEYVKGLIPRGVQVVIAGAGGAAHLAGNIAAQTRLPVIGVPIDSSPLKGLDSLLSTVQMPSGVPVATVSIGKAGSKNAGILAVQILALASPALADRLKQYKDSLEKGVAQKGGPLNV